MLVLEMDIDIIKRIPINTNIRDKFIWYYDKMGKYSVKSGYKLFMNTKINEASSSTYPMGSVWKNLWKLFVPMKIKHFCWKALNNFIPMNLNLKNRGVDVVIYCPICFKFP